MSIDLDPEQTSTILASNRHEYPLWRRLLPAAMASLGLHLLLMSLFLTVSVQFADSILTPLSSGESADYEMALLERDFPVDDVADSSAMPVEASNPGQPKGPTLMHQPVRQQSVPSDVGDFAVLRRLLEKTSSTNEPETSGLKKTWIIGPVKAGIELSPCWGPAGPGRPADTHMMMQVAAESITVEQDGRVKLAPCVIVRFFAVKDREEPSPLVTIRCEEAYFKLDQPIRSAGELGNRKIVSVELADGFHFAVEK
jgi:hypothetical protein